MAHRLNRQSNRAPARPQLDQACNPPTHPTTTTCAHLHAQTNLILSWTAQTQPHTLHRPCTHLHAHKLDHPPHLVLDGRHGEQVPEGRAILLVYRRAGEEAGAGGVDSGGGWAPGAGGSMARLAQRARTSLPNRLQVLAAVPLIFPQRAAQQQQAPAVACGSSTI